MTVLRIMMWLQTEQFIWPLRIAASQTICRGADRRYRAAIFLPLTTIASPSRCATKKDRTMSTKNMSCKA